MVFLFLQRYVKCVCIFVNINNIPNHSNKGSTFLCYNLYVVRLTKCHSRNQNVYDHYFCMNSLPYPNELCTVNFTLSVGVHNEILPPKIKFHFETSCIDWFPERRINRIIIRYKGEHNNYFHMSYNVYLVVIVF